MALGAKTGGRIKGTPNKLTRAGREAFERAFRGIGGQKALAAWAKENRTDFYKLYARLLPQEIAAQHEGSLEVLIRTFGAGDAQ